MVALETAAFVIDSMLREVGVAELARQAKKVADTAERLSAQAQRVTMQMRSSLRSTDLLGSLQLQRAASKLSDDALASFANSSLNQASGMMGEIRSAIANGELEDAKSMLVTLADQLAQFAESLADERQQRSEQQDNELSERFEALMEDLEKLAADQEILATELAQAQEALARTSPSE